MCIFFLLLLLKLKFTNFDYYDKNKAKNAKKKVFPVKMTHKNNFYTV